MSARLEATHATDAETRYQALVDLANEEPSAEAAARAVALLDDQAEVCIDEGSSIHDVEPTYRAVGGAAYDALCRMRAFMWPAIERAWASASTGARSAMLSALKTTPLDVRARYPDAAHALLENDARTVGVAQSIAIAEWERAFAARVRSGELEQPEAFWRAAHGHPSPVERDRSFIPLASVVGDPVALARELATLLRGKGVWPQYLVAALVRLPPVMPDDLIEALLAGDLVHKHPETWSWIAKHPHHGTAVTALCLDVLNPGTLNGRPWSRPTMLLERRWRLATGALKTLGPLSPEVRALLLDRLATTNESPSIQGSLRKWWCDLLGNDHGAIEATLEPRLQEMEQSEDPVAKERARQLRLRFSVMKNAGK